MKIELKQRDYGKLEDTTCGLRVWHKPKQTGVYVIGADVAEGIGKDASCAQVINTTTGVLVASYWSNVVDVDNYAAELFKLGHYYNKAQICLELNNHGHAVAALMGGAVGALYYPNLYKRLVLDEYTQKKTKQIGFKTTQSTKPRIISNMKAALRDGDLIVQDRYTILELSNFVIDSKTGRMAAGGNSRDDRVMSLALAWEAARQVIETQNLTKETHGYEQQYDKVTGFPIIGY